MRNAMNSSHPARVHFRDRVYNIDRLNIEYIHYHISPFVYFTGKLIDLGNWKVKKKQIRLKSTTKEKRNSANVVINDENTCKPRLDIPPRSEKMAFYVDDDYSKVFFAFYYCILFNVHV